MSTAGTIARLREAGARLRSLAPEEALAGLARVLDDWSDPLSTPRRELARRLPDATGLSPANVEAGLELALSGWKGGAAGELVARELGALPDEPLPGITTVVHGGVIPMPTLVDLVAPLLLRSPVLSRPGRHDPVTPRLFAESVARHAPGLADAISVAAFARDDEPAWREILAVERVCVTGSDAAVESLRARMPEDSRLVAHGDKVSLALLGPEGGDDLAPAARALSIDVALWDQLGCLSPVACLVLGPPERARAFAARLAEALAERERHWPRGHVAPAAAARIAHERAAAELRAAAGRDVVLHAGDAFTVIAEEDGAPRDAPLHRFVRVHPVAAMDEARACLTPLVGRVAALACEGFSSPTGTAELARALGATRRASFGRLQAPPLDWARDDLGVLTALL